MLRMGSALCEAFVRLSLAYIILLACPNSFRQIVFHAFCTFMDINMPCLYPHAGPNGMGCVPCYSSCFFFFVCPVNVRLVFAFLFAAIGHGQIDTLAVHTRRVT